VTALEVAALVALPGAFALGWLFRGSRTRTTQNTPVPGHSALTPAYPPPSGTGKDAPAAEPSISGLRRDASPQVYRTAVPALFESIVTYLSKTTEPLHNSHFAISQSLQLLLLGLTEHETEVVESTTLNRIRSGNSTVRSLMEETARQTNHLLGRFEKDVGAVQRLMDSIFELTAGIADIAERVHVLSINASIEAARAGAHGLGFKVIAGETQRLARETGTLASRVAGEVQSSGAIFHEIGTALDANSGQLAQLLSAEKGAFDELDLVIEGHYSKFQALYRTIREFTVELGPRMDEMFPVAMIHAVIVQEIENLSRLTGHLFDSWGTAGPLSDRDQAETVRGFLTTSRELDALDSALKVVGLAGQIDLKRRNDEVEFFV
jgi:hypothetical protein